MKNQWITPDEFAAQRGMTGDHVRHLIRAKVIAAHNIGSQRKPRYRINAEQARRYDESTLTKAA